MNSLLSGLIVRIGGSQRDIGSSPSAKYSKIKKLSYKAVVSVICSIILFFLPIGAYTANSRHLLPVYGMSAEIDAGNAGDQKDAEKSVTETVPSTEPADEVKETDGAPIYSGNLKELNTIGPTISAPENDTIAPTLNAAISDGILTVDAYDAESEIAVIYVNEYPYKELEDGHLTIRLQQFDSGYEMFKIQAEDSAGNLSEYYYLNNPYYVGTEKANSTDTDPAAALPVNAAATPPSNANAKVTEHMKTDEKGNSVKPNTKENIEPNIEDTKADEKERGKEFYTIQTASEKVFYLIIDRTGDEETVHFLTAISENDLLNTVDTTSNTLPKNSAALDNGNITEKALPNNNIVVEGSKQTEEKDTEAVEEDAKEEKDAKVAKEKKPIQESTVGTYVLYAVVAVAVIAIAYFVKFRKKREEFLDEEDDEDEEEFFEEDESTGSNDTEVDAEDDA